ncbi:hypothetical protein BT96DRAFT_944930 [Gymnopus androsaceus JB14]|uniref:Uncharacterized protein n=1 Tax=Gymnopus androsaceus JB14 TaxID=1447944 RepID=A0A6A4H1I1_9AGAR|nr:hypothetical protein BT96DRAFT_944930 [Gymnopus androsaceus JB14]
MQAQDAALPSAKRKLLLPFGKSTRQQAEPAGKRARTQEPDFFSKRLPYAPSLTQFLLARGSCSIGFSCFALGFDCFTAAWSILLLLPRNWIRSASESTVISGRDRHDAHTEALRAFRLLVSNYSSQLQVLLQVRQLNSKHNLGLFATENGDKDSMNSNTEADIRYLQAEVECLIQHEVKTKGNNLRGILRVVGSTIPIILRHAPWNSDEPNFGDLRNVLLGDQTSCETGSGIAPNGG